MPSGKFVIGGSAALGALFARFRRRPAPPPEPAPEPPPEPELEDEPWEDLAAEEVLELREELRRELDRLAGADIKASRTRREPTSPPG
jgi:hypothetical protein